MSIFFWIPIFGATQKSKPAALPVLQLIGMRQSGLMSVMQEFFPSNYFIALFRKSNIHNGYFNKQIYCRTWGS